jgi:hypothetical protein
MDPKIHYCVHKGPLILKPCITFCNKLVFYGEKLLVPHPIPKLKDHLLLAVCNCIFDIFVVTSSIATVWNIFDLINTPHNVQYIHLTLCENTERLDTIRAQLKTCDQITHTNIVLKIIPF